MAGAVPKVKLVAPEKTRLQFVKGAFVALFRHMGTDSGRVTGVLEETLKVWVIALVCERRKLTLPPEKLTVLFVSGLPAESCHWPEPLTASWAVMAPV